MNAIPYVEAAKAARKSAHYWRRRAGANWRKDKPYALACEEQAHEAYARAYRFLDFARARKAKERPQ